MFEIGEPSNVFKNSFHFKQYSFCTWLGYFLFQKFKNNCYLKPKEIKTIHRLRFTQKNIHFWQTYKPKNKFDSQLHTLKLSNRNKYINISEEKTHINSTKSKQSGIAPFLIGTWNRRYIFFISLIEIRSSIRSFIFHEIDISVKIPYNFQNLPYLGELNQWPQIKNTSTLSLGHA